ncbi:hypothetical protein ABIB38_003146 [Massilia sp. UYP11]
MPGPCALHDESDEAVVWGDRLRPYATNRAAFAPIPGPMSGMECHNVEIVEGEACRET